MNLRIKGFMALIERSFTSSSIQFPLLLKVLRSHSSLFQLISITQLFSSFIFPSSQRLYNLDYSRTMPALTHAVLKQSGKVNQVAPFSPPSLRPAASALSAELSPIISGHFEVENVDEDWSPDTTLVGSDSEVSNLIARPVTESKRVNIHQQEQIELPSKSPLGRISTSVVAINSSSDTGQGTHTRWLESTVTTSREWLNDRLCTVLTQTTSSATLEGTHTRWAYATPSSPSLTEESRRFTGPIRNNTRPRGGVTYRFTPTMLRPVQRWTPHPLQGPTLYTVPPLQNQHKYLARQVQLGPYNPPDIVPIPFSGPLLPQGTILVDRKGNPVSGLSLLKRGDTLVINHECEMEESMEL